MRRYIGLDVHKASTTFGVINESGKRVGTHVVETNGEALVAQMRVIAGDKHVCLEEGTQSAWLYEILRPHATEVVVAIVSGRRGPKNDERDAFDLAERLRTGAIQRKVFKEEGEYKELRELARSHTMVVQDVVRVQNRLKALLRSRGVSVSGKGIYSEEGRTRCLERLPEASRGAARTLFTEYDAVEPIRCQAEKDLVAEAHRHAVSRLLETCPGLGPIRVAQLISIVVSPERFRTKRQFWSYCGLAIVMRSSSDWTKNEKGDWQRDKVQQTRTRSADRVVTSSAGRAILHAHAIPTACAAAPSLRGGVDPARGRPSRKRALAGGVRRIAPHPSRSAPLVEVAPRRRAALAGP